MLNGRERAGRIELVRQSPVLTGRKCSLAFPLMATVMFTHIHVPTPGFYVRMVNAIADAQIQLSHVATVWLHAF